MTVKKTRKSDAMGLNRRSLLRIPSALLAAGVLGPIDLNAQTGPAPSIGGTSAGVPASSGLTSSPNPSPVGSSVGRPLRLIVPYPPGGPLDLAARSLAESARPVLGQIIVENRSGAGGNLGADAVAKSAPDGHTLLLGAVATHAINPWLYSKMPYDAERDFIPITLIANVPNVLVLETAFAARNRIDSVPAFVQYLRSHPGQLSFGSGGNGSAGHLAGELFKMQTGTFAVHIPYRGAAPAQLALQGGEIQFMFDNLASAAPRIRDGRIRALAVTTRQAASAFPDLKPLASAGVAELKSFDISTWFGLFAPANTPADVIERLHGGFTGAMQSRAFRDLMATLAAEPSPTSPREFAALIAQESRKYQAIVRHAKATVD